MTDGAQPGRPRESCDDVVVVLPGQDRDDLVRELRQQLAPLLDAPPTALVVDLSHLNRLSSGAVAALLWLRSACRPRGVPVRLRHVPPGGAATLRRTGLGSALPLEEASR